MGWRNMSRSKRSMGRNSMNRSSITDVRRVTRRQPNPMSRLGGGTGSREEKGFLISVRRGKEESRRSSMRVVSSMTDVHRGYQTLWC